MMYEECPLCHAHEVHSEGRDTCACASCGAQFEMDEDEDGDPCVGSLIDV